MATAAYSAGISHIAFYAPVLPSATAITTNRASATFPATRQSDSSRISTLHSVFSRLPCCFSRRSLLFGMNPIAPCDPIC
ncbi:hypothetical protein AB1Y20_010408 [Prymnesium parvum]|uniref:Uncharacterized protein n=1 Tax=Prymnesium parvum TaxID=97485 RepID=A0AB34IS51_PRYPA